MDALSEHEPKVENWGLPALEQRRERTREHLAQITSRRETGISSAERRNEYF